MEFLVFLALVAAAFFTVLASFSQTTKRTILFLSLQAATVGFVELLYCLFDLILGLHVQALIDFFAIFAEWFSCAAVSPLIIYWGMMQTENTTDQPASGSIVLRIVTAAIVFSHVVFGWWLLSLLPIKLQPLPFCSFMLSFSILFMATRKDPLKIIVGLNMAENALYPFLAESPLSLIPFMLGLMIFVNLVAVFVIVESRREYGESLITKWRGTT